MLFGTVLNGSLYIYNDIILHTTVLKETLRFDMERDVGTRVYSVSKPSYTLGNISCITMCSLILRS